MKKINFKQPKYVFPLVILLPIVFLAFQLSKLFGGSDDTAKQNFRHRLYRNKYCRQWRRLSTSRTISRSPTSSATHMERTSAEPPGDSEIFVIFVL